jgi:hypothetical protein
MGARNRVVIGLSYWPASAGIFKQAMGARNRVVIPVRQTTQPGGIGFLESILGLFQSLKLRHRLHKLESILLAH